MYRQTVVKYWIYCLSVVLISLIPLAYSQTSKTASFRSYSYSGRYISHRNFLGYIEPISNATAKNATYKLVPGLVGRCTSFESLSHPGYFLRHHHFRLKLARRSEDRLFREDASFCIVPGLFDRNASSFRSVNFPSHYIRHRNFELWLDRSDGRSSFNKEATFIKSSPLYKPSGGLGLPSREILISKVWQFGRSDGTVLVSRMRLLPNGQLQGANNSNESRWAVVGKELLFYDGNGKVSTRYDSFRQEGGRWVISGRFLFWGNITHVLKEIGG